MHLHDVIFLALALFIILLMLAGGTITSPQSVVRRALGAPVRALAKSRDEKRDED
jgi:hypothetical protein